MSGDFHGKYDVEGECSPGGNIDDHICAIFSKEITPDNNGEIKVTAEISLDLSKEHIADDPHRQSYVQLICGTNASERPYLGEVNTDFATAQWKSDVKTKAVKGKPVWIGLLVTPRGGTTVKVTGSIKIN